MRVVEVHITVTSLGETFSSMRRWLDQKLNGSPPHPLPVDLNAFGLRR